MENKWNLDKVEFDFLTEETQEINPVQLKPYKIMIADDDQEVHSVTKMMLKDFTFEGKELLFIDTYTGAETQEMLALHPDTAVLFLDVVMENHHSGLKVVEFLRTVLGNELTRIILRTGQSGEAPEESVIRDYDINDYRLKTDMTLQRLNTSLLTALRNYRDLIKIESSRKGLEKIIQASSNLFSHHSLEDFFECILHQIGSFIHEDAELVFIRNEGIAAQGFVTFGQHTEPVIVAATEKYTTCIGKSLHEIDALNDVFKWISNHENSLSEVTYINNGLIIKKNGRNNLHSYIFIEGSKKRFDTDLINLYMTNYSVALDNFILNAMINSTQKEIIMTFGRVTEKHFDETDAHVKRISEMMYRFSLLNQFTHAESEMLKIASAMHDIGKIGIPDAILKKPGKLSEAEFEIIKTHPLIGYQILCESKLDILKASAEIALNHHEKWNGTGYPNGLQGEEIPMNARMLAIIDVYDAMTHKRCYKNADSSEAAVAYILENKGKHFDPQLVGYRQDFFAN